ncbi:MAG TPA: UvrD-helicase domain-containing protein [Opitutaceae bacterium]|jgi:ATP-dependent exoDNAse (exonuclease V) beta subunit|nr:UvrD-helicase domain-containing protein [Opitutaceae bacterium]
MSSQPRDQAARDRFTGEWGVNLAVVANAGSGKTTAISKRLAAVALSPDGAKVLKRTTVVTYTKKAAAQIEQSARAELLRRMAGGAAGGAGALAAMDRVFFGTIHSFCLLLARRHGSTLGIHLNPTVIDGDDDSTWQEFLEGDTMTFASLGKARVGAFLRHATLDDMFELAKGLDHATATRLAAVPPAGMPPPPAQAALDDILGATSLRRGPAAEALQRNKDAAAAWTAQFATGSGRLPFADPEGKASGIVDLYRRLYAPLKAWMAAAGGALAAELSLRYRDWRKERGIQTYADQIETALSVLGSPVLLEHIRAEGWRVILDEAQDTDREQFAVLVEITREPGSPRGTWPHGGGAAPRPGHFCMVGDPQQGIYSERADIANFRRHVEAFERGDGGEKLTFDVTFRSPGRVVRLLNETLPEAFGPERFFNLGLPPADGAPAPFLQVGYEPLVTGPVNPEGAALRLPIEPTVVTGRKDVADKKLAGEARQVARLLVGSGPGAVGASCLGDICILAPRTEWLMIVREAMEEEGLKTALQIRRNRNGDNPAYAWLCGLLAVACDPDNTFEWVGILREVFAVSDAVIASSVRGPLGFRWDEPDDQPAPVADALRLMRSFVERVDLDGEELLSYASDIVSACRLSEKAALLDPEGGLEDELSRLLARAAEIGAQGGGPREWLRDLLASVGAFRAAGRPSPDSVNLITCHSSKGLEWPVVIPMGLWREIKVKAPAGMRLVAVAPGVSRVVFDNDGVGGDTNESLRRARLRTDARLLYVTLTRSRTALVVPWADEAPEKNSFAELWGLDPNQLDPLIADLARVPPGPAPADVEAAAEPVPPTPAVPPAPFPRRVLPHELAKSPDAARAALHEASTELPVPLRDSADPLEYGIWWHETLEFLPWAGDPAALKAHGEASLARASQQGFAKRGAEDWARLISSQVFLQLKDPRWSRMAEAGIFAPLPPGQWIDGVIDLVLHDSAAREVWIVDWKTNRRRLSEADPALLARLALDYQSQLRAYGACASGFFEGCSVRLWVYSTEAGLLGEIPASP